MIDWLNEIIDEKSFRELEYGDAPYSEISFERL